MESLSINDTAEGHDVKIASKPLEFHKSYNDPSANVVLTSKNDISFRVDDFHLKSASPVFRDMLSLPTKGGAIKLPDQTEVICIVLDHLTGIESMFLPNFHTMVEALDLAKRFDMKGVFSQIKIKLHGYKEGPRLLALACQQVPIDRLLARTALSRFSNDMGMYRYIFRSEIGRDKSRIPRPDPANLETEYLESLTTAGCIAFSKSLAECELDKGGNWNWDRVPAEFRKALDHLGR